MNIVTTSLSFRPLFAWALIVVLSSSFIAAFMSLQAGLFVLLFAAVGWWVWTSPEDGFLFLVVTAPLLLLLKSTQTIPTVTLIKDVIIIVLFLRLFVLPLFSQRLPYRRHLFVLPIIVLAVWTLFSAVRSESVLLGVLRARDILLYPLLYFAVAYLPSDQKHNQTRYRWFVFTVAVVGLLAAYQWFFAQDSTVLRFDPARQIWIPRLSSILAHPSIFGQYLVVATSLFAAVVVATRATWVRVLHAVAIIISLALIYLTYSRAVWLGLGAALFSMGIAFCLYLIRQKHALRRHSLLILMTGAVAVLLLVLAIKLTPVGVFLRSAFDPTYKSNEERIEFLARLISPVTNTEALFGQGLGDVLAQNFRKVDIESYDIASGASQVVQATKDTTLVDNQHLKTFIEMGLTGLLVYGWIYWRFLYGSWHLFQRGNSQTARIVGLWGIGFLAAFVLQALFIDIWEIFPTNAIFWVLAGLIVRCFN